MLGEPVQLGYADVVFSVFCWAHFLLCCVVLCCVVLCYSGLAELAGRRQGHFSFLSNYQEVLCRSGSRSQRHIKYLAPAQSRSRNRSRQPRVFKFSVFMCLALTSRPPQTPPPPPCVPSASVGEATDDGEREEEDHVLRHLPRHRHHLRGVVALRPHRQDGRGDQTRSAQTRTRTHTPTHVRMTLTTSSGVWCGVRPFTSTVSRRLRIIHASWFVTNLHKWSVMWVVWVMSVTCSLRLEYTRGCDSHAGAAESQLRPNNV